jgi:dTDP-4-amino-4,6-dideoxygalactose transaminase
MHMDTCTNLRVPFVDLHAQFESIGEEVQGAIAAVLRTGCFVGGEWVERFENAFSSYVGAPYAVALASGTDALELALRASGIGEGDEVIVPANSFFATAEAISNSGAKPVFADVDALTFHLDIRSAEKVLTPVTRAIIPVHLYGRAMDTREVEQFAVLHNLIVIEDAAQAHGDKIHGTTIGGSRNLCCFSFYPGKNLGAYGDAGCVTGADSDVIRRIRLLRDHGSVTKYEHLIVGRNSRLDAIQAAVLCVKLTYLDDWNKLRRRHAARYVDLLSGLPLTTPKIPPGLEHNFHLFVVRSGDRASLQAHLQRNGISTGTHYPIPLHLTKAYQDLGYRGFGSLPVTESLAREVLSLPMFPELSDDQIQHTVEAIREFYRV